MASKDTSRSTRRDPAADEMVQQGNGGRSVVKDDLLKRTLQHHPGREEPRIEDFEPDDVGSGSGRSSTGSAPAR